MTRTSLAKNGTPRLFYWMLQQRFTGLVHLHGMPGLADAKIWMHEGLPWFTDLAHSSSLLGELMLRKRWISESALHQVLLDMAQSRRLLGHIMVERALIDGPTLGRALAYQCEHKLLHLFELRTGEASLEPQAQLRGLAAGLCQGVNTLHLIMQGVRQHWPLARIASVWGQVQGNRARAGERFLQYAEHFGLQAQERSAGSTLTGGWDMHTQEHERELVRLAFVLWNCDMLELQAKPQPGQAAAPPTKARPKSSNAAAVSPKKPASRARPGAAGNHVAVPTARSGRPKTTPGFKGKPTKSAETSRLHRLPARLMQAHAANQKSQENKQPQDRASFMAQLELREGLIARDVNAFALFDLPLTATRGQIRKKWQEISRVLHPDVLPKLGLGSMHNRTQRVFAHISNAYQLLSNTERRNELKASLQAGVGDGKTASDVVRQTLEAEVLVRDAERLIKKHQYEKAMQTLQEAHKLRSDEPEVLAGMAWCQYQLKGRDEAASAQAISELKTLVEAGTKCANAAYYLGMLYAAKSQRNQAHAAFSRALEINPRLIDAERQLRVLAQPKAVDVDKNKKRKLFGR